MNDLQLDARVALRMGYDEAVAATALDARGIAIEVALVPPSDPGGRSFEREWNVVIHYGCDPDHPDQGTSGVEPCGEDRGEAESFYLRRIAEIESDIAAEPGQSPTA
jgi:hypothetical protein